MGGVQEITGPLSVYTQSVSSLHCTEIYTIEMAASWECPSLPMIQLPMKESSKVTFLAVKPVRLVDYPCSCVRVAMSDEHDCILWCR